MSIQAFTSPEVYLGAALVIFLVLLIASMVLNTRRDARMEFFSELMKDFPKDGENESGGSRPVAEEGAEEEPVLPSPRHIDFCLLVSVAVGLAACPMFTKLRLLL
jgi:hypothetical protein